MVLVLWMITADYHGDSKVVTINNNGISSIACCVDGSCPCNSFSFALENITNHTIINITSESVTLNTTIPIGSGNLHNITITGNGPTIMCNNSGGVYCMSCSDVIIEGITWDKCGDPNKKDTVAAVYFAVAHDIKIQKCNFQKSKVCALILNQASSNIIVRNSKFSNNVIQGQDDNECSGLKIRTTNANASIAILDSSFVGNRHVKSSYTSYGLFVKVMGNPKSYFSLIVSRTVFLSNSLGANIFVQASFIAPIVLSKLVFSNNTHQGILLPTLDASHISLTLSNTSFTNNGNGGIVCAILSENSDKKMANIRLEHSNFTNNSASTAYSSAVYFHLATNDNSVYNVSIEYCNFTNNNNGTIWIFTTESKLSLYLVIIKEVLVTGSQMIGNPTGGGAVSVILNGFMNNTIIINSVKFLSNNYMGVAGGALYIKTTNGNGLFYITNCHFQENTANGEDAALFIVDDNTGSSITMCRTYICPIKLY